MKRIKQILSSIVLMFKKKKILTIKEVVKEEKSLFKKTALIIGGTGGIGFAIAKRLNLNGCNIIACSTSRQKIELCKKLIPESESFKYFIFDVTNIDKIDEYIDNASKIFNGIDIMICSNGVHTENAVPLEFTEADFDRVIDVNLKGSFFCGNKFGNYLKKNKIQGNILFISSSRGSEPAFSPYGLSKWALNGYIRGLASYLSDYGITVNGIAPGTTSTQLVGYKTGDSIHCFENKFERMVTPEEVAELAAFLVGSNGKMMSGEVINISGGRGIFDVR